MMRIRPALLAGILMLCLTSSVLARVPVVFAVRTQGEVGWFQVGSGELQEAPARADGVPLGSVWKLFVYAYLLGAAKESSDYTCRGQLREEVYCCEPGGRIGREAALQRSCGLYFQPARLALRAEDWQSYWQRQSAPAWLQRLDNLREDFRVPVPSLLVALDSVPAEVRDQAGQALIGVLTRDNAKGLIAEYGSLLRGKTWTMPDPARPGAHIGGAAGWLADGKAFWLGGAGSGIEVLRAAQAGLAPYLAGLRVPDDAQCVQVRFFARYPLRSVLRLPAREPVRDGPLRGDFLAVFERGTELPFRAQGELSLQQLQGQPVVTGRLGLNDYVARVVEREAGPAPVAAARALAVAARSYLVQQAPRSVGCFQIDDSTASQRVGPRPPAAEARRIADWSADMILRGVSVRYHLDLQAPDVLSWRMAREQAAQGLRADAILARAFPSGYLAGLNVQAQDDCRSAPEAERWLAERVRRWRPVLTREPGYSEPATLPAVCVTGADRPFADTERHRLHVRGWRAQQDHLALAHEYLHLAFEGHPRAYDEADVERLARRLILETP